MNLWRQHSWINFENVLLWHTNQKLLKTCNQLGRDRSGLKLWVPLRNTFRTKGNLQLFLSSFAERCRWSKILLEERERKCVEKRRKIYVTLKKPPGEEDTQGKKGGRTEDHFAACLAHLYFPREFLPRLFAKANCKGCHRRRRRRRPTRRFYSPP